MNKSELFVRLADGKAVKIQGDLVTPEWNKFIGSLITRGHVTLFLLRANSNEYTLQLTEKGLAAWKNAVVKLLVARKKIRPGHQVRIKIVDKPQPPRVAKKTVRSRA